MSEHINTENLFLTVAEVAKRYAVSTDTIWRWSRKDDFPRPVKIGPNITRWRLADVLEHDQSLKAGFAFCLTLVA